MDPHPEWWRDFFTGLTLDMWRAVPQNTAAEADFLLAELQPPPGGRLLDVPCGTGRLTLALAERGLAVTGVDLTNDLLDDGLRAAAGKNLSVTFEHREMRDLPWPAAFDGVFCFGNSFGYLGEEGDAAFLRAVAATLKPGARFVLATNFAAESVLIHRLQKSWFDLNGLLFLVDTAYDPPTGRLTSSYVMIRDGKVERRQAVYQVYPYRELVRRFAEAGFGDVKAYGGLGREPFALGSPGLWLVGTRR
jgi:SAM-dependent methyltransferase